jgi:hypothetical protein
MATTQTLNIIMADHLKPDLGGCKVRSETNSDAINQD